MDRVHARRVERYGDDRDDQECRGGAVEEHAGDEQDHIGDHEEHERILAERKQFPREYLRDLLDRHDPAEEGGNAHDDQDSRRALEGLIGGVQHVLQGQCSIEKGGDQQHIDHCDRRGLGRGEDTQKHTRNQQHRRHQCRDGGHEVPPEFPECRPALRTRIPTPEGQDHHGNHQERNAD